jgi:hypothetical protein
LEGIFQDIVTVYNKYTKGLGNWTGGMPPVSSVAWDRTIIRNVMWKDNIHNNQKADGSSFIDKTVSITIPEDKMEVDGNKRFANQNEYISLPVDTANVWTLQIGDIIVWGECYREISTLYTITNLQRDYQAVEIKAISDSSEQDTLPMWHIEGQ